MERWQTEQGYDAADMKAAEVVNTVLEVDMHAHHRWAIKKTYGFVMVWRFPQLDLAETLKDAEIEFESRLKRKPEVSGYFKV